MNGTLNVVNIGEAGVYRLFDYDGALYGNGLIIGQVPEGINPANLVIVTGNSQVNLEFAGNYVFQYWDGSNTQANNKVDGGSGTWDAITHNWTTSDGAHNGAMQPVPIFAIFKGDAGEVKVDHLHGSISVAGMQFMTSGYVITGDLIKLAGEGETIIKVGDGTDAGAEYVATIESELTGESKLVKTDLGTLILAGENTYTGGTEVKEGTLALSGDGSIENSAYVQIGANGIFDISDAGGGATIGGLKGDAGGMVMLGSQTLIVTGDGETYSVISDGGIKSGEGGNLVVEGKLKLGGVNTYTGETTIQNGGTLYLVDSGSIANSAGVTIAEGSAFDISGTFGGATIKALNGSGAVYIGSKTLTITSGGEYDGIIKDGGFTEATGGGLTVSGGNLILKGHNTYTGLTSILAGATLQSDAGSVAGGVDVQNEGTFKLSNGGGVGGSVDNSGAMTVDGGNANITGVLANNGTVTISAPAQLTVADFQGALGTAVINVASGATFTFGSDGQDYSYAGLFTGDGTVIKTGGGIQTLTGINDDNDVFTGTFQVAGGTLVVNGTLGDPNSRAATVVVDSGATLGGTGSIAGSVTIQDGGTISPGESIGTINIDGDLTFIAGSRYKLDIDPVSETSDLIRVGGNAFLTGAEVHLYANGMFGPSSRYLILSANGELHGNFGPIISDFAFLDPTITYDGSDVYLELIRNDVAFCLPGMTPNQCATGKGVESTGSGNPVYEAVVGLSAEQAASAFDQLSGEIHASAMSAFIEDSWFVRHAMRDRLRAAFNGFGDKGTSGMGDVSDGLMVAPTREGRALWARGFGSWGSIDGNGNAAALDTSTVGILTGFDGPIGDNVRLGILAGYSQLSFDVDERASSGSAQSYHLGIYGGTQWGDLGLRSGLAYTWSDIETDRTIMLPTLTNRLKADYDAGLFQAFGELGYRLKTTVGSFEPFANLAYVNLDTDSFAETGGAAALRGRSTTTDLTFTTLGIHAELAFNIGAVNLTIDSTVGWRHAFGDTIPALALAFNGSDAFTITGVPIAEDAAIIEAGVGVELTPNAALGLAYQGQIADGSAQHGVKGDLRIRF